jgi:hypothetical protein
MTVTFELTTEVEQTLRDALGDVGLAAKEALLVELYRQEKLTRHQLSIALALSRSDTDALLKRHDVFYDLTANDVEQQSAGLRPTADPTRASSPARLQRFAGALDSGNPHSSDNERIAADLAKAYGATNDQATRSASF